eukprot:CAMPEP_0114521986 /NCGR_PEP_ID=MMETSP0109-20121206/20504_1 /TAXON_ID=29199 /ORGANISM="Chlorarachnion reptans, Strain CCCM449" /LENGTH=1349 /DNA_ID=CAMNT_0001703179 /DNA_START=281 /DNA_END=4330 /DNA_ORIENTATION=+
MSTLAHCSYVPSALVEHFKELYESKGEKIAAPFRQSYETAVLFADVSGFTKLAERLAVEDPDRGHELLHENINTYFVRIIRVIGSQGGDIFKFVGDAMIVLWPKSSQEDLRSLVQRAGQCAMQIKSQCQGFEIKLSKESKLENLRLNVKVGIGVGRINILHVGGIYDRLEYVPTGGALLQAFNAEKQADAKNKDERVIMSPKAYALVSDIFTATKRASGYACIKECNKTVRKTSLIHIMRSILEGVDQDYVRKRVSQYEPAAVRPYIESFEEQWAAESRDVTVLFVELGLSEERLCNMSNEKTSSGDLNWVHDIISIVQTAVYRYEGSINKFLMDDKGSTLLAVFGLPPLAHEDDPLRALFASMQICTELKLKHGLYPSIGVTTGSAFCGIIGNVSRREYTVLGDCVNLAARLMQYSKEQHGGVICDGATWHITRSDIKFYFLGKIDVKGKKKPVKIFHPYAQDAITNFVRPEIKERALKNSVLDGLDSFRLGKLPKEGYNPKQMLLSEVQHSRTKFGDPRSSLTSRQFEPQLFQDAVVQIDGLVRKAITGNGSVFVCESDVGLGKTRLCARINFMWRSRASVTYMKAHGFNVRTILCSFRPLIIKIVDPLDEGDYKQICATIHEAMEKAKIPKKNAGVMNEILPIKIAEIEDTLAMPTKDRIRQCIDICASIIIIACERRKSDAMILLIDDAIFLNEHSWTLLNLLASKAQYLSLFILVTTRPITKTYCASYAKDPTPWYNELVTRPGTAFKQLEPLPDDVIYRIVCQSLRVNDCPPELAHFIIQEAHGNPNIIRDFVFILEEKEHLFTVDAGSVILRKGINWETLKRDVRCPRSVRMLAARQLDRLSHKAQIMLKIGALIGETFQFWLIEEAYPLKDRTGLWEHFLNLLEWNIIMKHEEITRWDEEAKEPTKTDSFVFTNRLMGNLLRSRTVRKQAHRLQNLIDSAKLKRAAALAAESLKDEEKVTRLIVYLSLEKKPVGKFLALVIETGLYFYKSETEWQHGGANSISAYIDLSSCLVHEMVDPGCVKIDAYNWMHEGQFREQKGAFTIKSIVEGRPFPLTFFRTMKNRTSTFELSLLTKQRSIADMKLRYKKIQERKSRKDYTPSEKSKIEREFRSSVKFALRMVYKNPADHIRAYGNCMVLKSRKFIRFGEWKRRTALLTKNGLAFVNGHMAKSIQGPSPDRRISINASRMICLKTHSCKVQMEKPPKLLMAELPRSHPFPLFIQALLWAKGEKMVWSMKLFVITFDTKEKQTIWKTKIRKIINVHHHGEASGSKLAKFYRSSARYTPRPSAIHLAKIQSALASLSEVSGIPVDLLNDSELESGAEEIEGNCSATGSMLSHVKE